MSTAPPPAAPRASPLPPPCAPTRTPDLALAEAAEALSKTVALMERDQDVLQALLAEAGDNQQLKMSKVIPQLQKTMGGALPEYGFPPPPAGARPAAAARCTCARALPASRLSAARPPDSPRPPSARRHHDGGDGL